MATTFGQANSDCQTFAALFPNTSGDSTYATQFPTGETLNTSSSWSTALGTDVYCTNPSSLTDTTATNYYKWCVDETTTGSARDATSCNHK